MLEPKESPTTAATGSGEGLQHITIHTAKCSRPILKWRRVLLALAQGRSFNRFEAERSLSDHALHSTVSTLQSKGVRVERVMETVPGFMGEPTRVARYWLAPEQRTAALALLGCAP
jgi:hypothetical protein